MYLFNMTTYVNLEEIDAIEQYDQGGPRPYVLRVVLKSGRKYDGSYQFKTDRDRDGLRLSQCVDDIKARNNSSSLYAIESIMRRIEKALKDAGK